MLFDLRVVLAACLATFLFAAIGLSLLATSRSPFKTSAGYAANEGRGGLASPGLPKSRPLPLPETAEPETTGAIAEAPEAAAAPEPAKPEKAAKAAPAGKKQSIKALIEEDKAEQEKAKAAKPAKKKAHARHRTKKPPPQKSPFSIFTNNNTAPTAVR
jgi:hypothetical protein